MDVKKIVSKYVKKYGTRDPFKIARELNIEVQIGELGSKAGCYMYLKKHRCIFINENLSERQRMLVMAHELGHAIMHCRKNCYFIRNKTLFLNDKLEIEANKFAAELLIDDDILSENKYMTVEQLACLFGYNKKLVELKLGKN